jgi:cation diffusion facilitator family transporter
MPKKPISTGRVVVVSFVVDLLDIVTNLIVAVLTGSAVVFAEMAQGMADSIGSFLLVIGYRRSRRPRDEAHPLGYAREVFFWALLSSMIMLFLGSGLSLFRGFQQLTRAQPLDRPLLALAVMVLSVMTNGYALSQSVRKLRPEGSSLVEAFRSSSRQLVKTALLRDVLGTLSAVVGLIALGLYMVVGSVVFDAIGAMLIGALMCAFAVLLIAEARSYIAGQAVPNHVRRQILNAALSVDGVEAVNELAAVVAGSEEIDVELDLDLVDRLTTPQVEAVLDAVEGEIRRRVPNVRTVRVDLNPARPPRLGRGAAGE